MEKSDRLLFHARLSAIHLAAQCFMRQEKYEDCLNLLELLLVMDLPLQDDIFAVPSIVERAKLLSDPDQSVNIIAGN